VTNEVLDIQHVPVNQDEGVPELRECYRENAAYCACTDDEDRAVATTMSVVDAVLIQVHQSVYWWAA